MRQPRKPRGPRESSILADVRLAIGSRQDFTAYRVSAGVFRPVNGDPNIRVRVAPTGFPDLIGVQRRTVSRQTTANPDSFQPLTQVKPFTYGQAVAIETKTATGKQRKEQQDFEAEFIRLGGIYILARSVDDVLAVLGPGLTS